MHFDGTITLGAVLNIATLVVAILVFGLRMDGRLKMAEVWIEGNGRKIMEALDMLKTDVSYLKGHADGKRGPVELKDQY